jgi:hypothetical protein
MDIFVVNKQKLLSGWIVIKIAKRVVKDKVISVQTPSLANKVKNYLIKLRT